MEKNRAKGEQMTLTHFLSVFFLLKNISVRIAVYDKKH